MMLHIRTAQAAPSAHGATLRTYGAVSHPATARPPDRGPARSGSPEIRGSAGADMPTVLEDARALGWSRIEYVRRSDPGVVTLVRPGPHGGAGRSEKARCGQTTVIFRMSLSSNTS